MMDKMENLLDNFGIKKEGNYYWLPSNKKYTPGVKLYFVFPFGMNTCDTTALPIYMDILLDVLSLNIKGAFFSPHKIGINFTILECTIFKEEDIHPVMVSIWNTFNDSNLIPKYINTDFVKKSITIQTTTKNEDHNLIVGLDKRHKNMSRKIKDGGLENLLHNAQNIIKEENAFLFYQAREKLNVFDLKKYIVEKNGIDIIISDAELNKMDSYFIVENQDAQSQIDSIVNILYLFEDYDYVIFDTEGTVNNLTKAVLKATDYIFAPSKSSAIDINGLADLLNMYDISRVINPKLEIRKIFLVQTKQNTIVYKETKDELMKYFSNNEFSEISVREDQNILNSMKQQKDIFSYRSYSNAAIDYKNLVDEFLEEEEENEY